MTDGNVGLITQLIFLSSGLFLGWSLGANDAANAFGTAVGSRMLRFSTAAFLCSAFVILGAVVAGAGAADGLGELGAVNALGGSFTVALAAAITITAMTQLGLPVSTTQAIVGVIVAWNFFSGSITDLGALGEIVLTWVACPILGGLFAAGLYRLLVALIRRTKPHLLVRDSYTRLGLIVVGTFGSYSLGANNIGNVMGVFVASIQFEPLTLASLTLSAQGQLFLLGGVAIAVGVYTYSRRVMMTVGNSLLPLSPLGALAVVAAQSLVLFIFSSTTLSEAIARLGLPPIPLVPVSSSQAVVGAAVGIGLLQGWRGVQQIRWRVLRDIALGWVATPVVAGVLGSVLLFVVQNVFDQPVYQPTYYVLSRSAIAHLSAQGFAPDWLRAFQNSSLLNQVIPRAVDFRAAVRATLPGDRPTLNLNPALAATEQTVLAAARIDRVLIDRDRFPHLQNLNLSPDQIRAVERLGGERFTHPWQFDAALAAADPEAWTVPATAPAKAHKRLDAQRERVRRWFQIPSSQ